MVVKLLMFIFILLQISFIKCDVAKSSLAFVVDPSLAEDIKQWKTGFDTIFNAVSTSKNSPIENFILVTFNASEVQRVTVTRDKRIYKEALNDIVVDGSVTPKSIMAGIERALRDSLPRSFIYVITDAVPKDYGKYEQVKRLAQTKFTQVSFILTREDEGRPDPKYSKYYELAEATSGTVFSGRKSDYLQVMTYVGDSVKGPKVSISTEVLPPGIHDLPFIIDEHVYDVKISAFGTNPRLDGVFNSQGVKQATDTKINLPRMIVVSLLSKQSGDYKAVLGSESETRVNIDGLSEVSFSHGFSSIKPFDFTNATMHPKSGVHKFLGIQSNTPKNVNIILKTVKLLASSGNVILEKPLELSNKKKQLYVAEILELPKDKFRLEVTAYDVIKNNNIKRLLQGVIEPEP